MGHAICLHVCSNACCRSSMSISKSDYLNLSFYIARNFAHCTICALCSGAVCSDVVEGGGVPLLSILFSASVAFRILVTDPWNLMFFKHWLWRFPSCGLLQLRAKLRFVTTRRLRLTGGRINETSFLFQSSVLSDDDQRATASASISLKLSSWSSGEHIFFLHFSTMQDPTIPLDQHGKDPSLQYVEHILAYFPLRV
jgi:hypothetical protein